MAQQEITLTDLARAGFSQFDRATKNLAVLASAVSLAQDDLLESLSLAADPDAALEAMLQLSRVQQERCALLFAQKEARDACALVCGASVGLAEFFARNPGQLSILENPCVVLPRYEHLQRTFFEALGVVDGCASYCGEEGWNLLRVCYRSVLAQIAVFDLTQSDPLSGVDRVSAALADLAAVVLDASLACARTQLSTPGAARWFFPRAEVSSITLSLIGMGKVGGRELNYVSDVDVIFVTGSAAELDVATRLAIATMQGITETAREPALWDVDVNLRPEGKTGALVRTLESHHVYYQRWAQSWEFQALLKARPLAGDLELGRRYCEHVLPLVWSSAARENFVESVQRMRERIVENIPAAHSESHIKLGQGGIRDIEFTVQLLQLVHGQADQTLRKSGTLEALAALAENGYIGRLEAKQFSDDYRTLRLLEHRLQLRYLQRTHVMPDNEEDQRFLARATGLAANAAGLVVAWNELKLRVRTLHERLFYRPLLAAVAALNPKEHSLSNAQASARLAAIGFRDPQGALAHIAAMTAGVSRRAVIQRNLAPVLLEWFATGADPDYGLLAFRRLSDSLGQTHWFLRMLRDSSGAALRLTQILANSRFAADLLGHIPESAAWLEHDADLRPREKSTLEEETRAIMLRHDTADSVAQALRTARRREILRMACAAILHTVSITDLAVALTEVTTVFLGGVVEAIRRDIAKKAVRAGDDSVADLEFAIIAMGRYGGREMGFGSDIDLLYVYRTFSADTEAAEKTARFIVAELVRLTEDHRLACDLDNGLRPEGKNGPVVRSLDSYRAYYQRWSLTWESQALLRAKAVVGDQALRSDFEKLADQIRFPAQITPEEIREVRRIKARIEKERLPQAADFTRHLKLGRGSLSDVEWCVQLLQLRYGVATPTLRTPSTLVALVAAVDAGYLGAEDADVLREAWIFASRIRSAMTLWAHRATDVLPTDRRELEGIARLLNYPAHSASVLEEDYLAATRRSRTVFERTFYGSE